MKVIFEGTGMVGRKVYRIEVPDEAKEVEKPSTSKQLIWLIDRKDALVKKGKDALLAHEHDYGHYPDYVCTHYVSNPIGCVCLMVKEGK